MIREFCSRTDGELKKPVAPCRLETAMTCHRIHLRGPWDYSFAPESFPSTMHGTVSMPKDWRAIFGNVSGCARFIRKFHRPTNLVPSDRVMVIFTEARGRGRLLLNGELAGSFVATADPLEFDVSALLKPFNKLEVEIHFDCAEWPDSAGGLCGAVALEIRNEVE